MDASILSRIQLSLAPFGLAGALMAGASAIPLRMNAVHAKRPFALVHRVSAWASLAVYLALSVTCVAFHFPLDDPASVLSMGAFAVHPILGPLGLVLYGGKLLAVRTFKAGWRLPGLAWGILLLLFWATQFATVVPAYAD